MVPHSDQPFLSENWLFNVTELFRIDTNKTQKLDFDAEMSLPFLTAKSCSNYNTAC